jgi:hypothetical protein
VLLHGFGGCAQNWYPFTAELSEHHRLIKRPGLRYRMHPMHQGRERFHYTLPGCFNRAICEERKSDAAAVLVSPMLFLDPFSSRSRPLDSRRR